MIDQDGFRLNVGIVLINEQNQLLWAKRVGQEAWQFPQGGIKEYETPEQALYRELDEEVGLSPEDVELLACTKKWLSYRLPKRFIRHYSRPICIGQKQKWFLLRLMCDDTRVHLDKSEIPEFESWRWITYWEPLAQVVSFKRQVYRRALQEFAPLVLKPHRKEK